MWDRIINATHKRTDTHKHTHSQPVNQDIIAHIYIYIYTHTHTNVYLQLPGDSMLDSGFKDNVRALPKPSAQDITALLVRCDPTQCTYQYTLLVLSIVKGRKLVAEDINLAEFDQPSKRRRGMAEPAGRKEDLERGAAHQVRWMQAAACAVYHT
jgi:hypothetical protein